MGRTARHQVLYPLPPTERKVGRPSQYGERAPTPAQWLGRRDGWRTARLTVRGRVREVSFRVEGPFLREGVPHHPVFLMVVRGRDRRVGQGKRRRGAPVFLVVSAVWRRGVRRGSWSCLLRGLRGCVKRFGRFGRGWGVVGRKSGCGWRGCGMRCWVAVGFRGGWSGWIGLMSVSVVGWVACSGVAQGSKTGWLWCCLRLKKPNFRLGQDAHATSGRDARAPSGFSPRL